MTMATTVEYPEKRKVEPPCAVTGRACVWVDCCWEPCDGPVCGEMYCRDCKIPRDFSLTPMEEEDP